MPVTIRHPWEWPKHNRVLFHSYHAHSLRSRQSAVIHVTKITKNHRNSNLIFFSPIIIFSSKIKFLIKLFDHVSNLIMCNILIMCKWHMITKLPIFTYFTLKSNIHHIPYITLHSHLIKIQVSSNYFELTLIVCILFQISINFPFFVIFYHFS